MRQRYSDEGIPLAYIGCVIIGNWITSIFLTLYGVDLN